MKTKSRNLIISFLLTLAMLLGVFAMTPLTASARAYPDPTNFPAETVYVGGVALNAGQYVKNGETTATTGEPAEDASGFAWYDEYGTLVLVDYTYQGKGYEYSSGNYALIYSTGMLYITGGGVNTLKQTQSHNMGIYSVGSLTIATTGTLTIEGDNCSCLYSNNEITFNRYLGKVYLNSTGNATAIVSYDNDGDSLSEQGIMVNGGDIYVETFYPISDLTIKYGALKISSPQNALDEIPDISNYDGNYTLTVSENEDGSNPSTYNQDTITTFDTDKIADYKYLRLAPPAKTVINSVSVSALDLPEIGESFVYPDETALTYGGEYIVSGCWIEKYTGTEWIYLEDAEVIEYSVQYRYVLTLRPNAGYTFPEDITDDNVTINGKDGEVLMTFPDDAFTTMVEVALEFSYEAPSATPITSISVSGADLPEVGETKDVMEFTPDSLTYGGEYKMVGRGFQKYTGTEWVDVSDTESLEYGVKYRVNLVLAPSEGYAFADSITSDDVTFNGEEGIFETLIPGVGYASILYEFSYEAPATDYGITIADKDELGATVGVLITEENCADVLGDGTVSYDPTTKTLTLNGYAYEGSGFEDDMDGAIFIDVPEDGMTINLMGENKIYVSSASGAGFATFGAGNVTVKGSGSLEMQVGMYGFMMMSGAALIVDGGNITIKTTGTPSAGLAVKNFIMNSGNLKIDSVFIGIITMDAANEIKINGGSLEIGVLSEGNTVAYATGEMVFASKALDLSGYVGAYKMTAGNNADGSDATDFNEGNLSSYKYVKVEPTHVHDHGTAWESDANEHWNECACGDKANKAAHTDSNNDNKCDTCDYAMPAQGPDNPSNTPDDPTEDKDGLGTGAIVGIVIGSVAVAGVGGFALFWFVIKKKTWADFLAIFKKK